MGQISLPSFNKNDQKDASQKAASSILARGMLKEIPKVPRPWIEHGTFKSSV